MTTTTTVHRMMCSGSVSGVTEYWCVVCGYRFILQNNMLNDSTFLKTILNYGDPDVRHPDNITMSPDYARILDAASDAAEAFRAFGEQIAKLQAELITARESRGPAQ